MLLAHLVFLNLIWVGFSAPYPRPPATFTYQGALPAQDTLSPNGEIWQLDKKIDRLLPSHFEASNLNHWVKLREPSKVKTYDHLGF